MIQRSLMLVTSPDNRLGDVAEPQMLEGKDRFGLVQVETARSRAACS